MELKQLLGIINGKAYYRRCGDELPKRDREKKVHIDMQRERRKEYSQRYTY